MSPRAFHSLVAALIRIGLLLVLVIMLMAENAQAQTPIASSVPTYTGHFQSLDKCGLGIQSISLRGPAPGTSQSDHSTA